MMYCYWWCPLGITIPNVSSEVSYILICVGLPPFVDNIKILGWQHVFARTKQLCLYLKGLFGLCHFTVLKWHLCADASLDRFFDLFSDVLPSYSSLASHHFSNLVRYHSSSQFTSFLSSLMFYPPRHVSSRISLFLYFTNTLSSSCSPAPHFPLDPLYFQFFFSSPSNLHHYFITSSLCWTIYVSLPLSFYISGRSIFNRRPTYLSIAFSLSPSPLALSHFSSTVHQGLPFWAWTIITLICVWRDS